MEEELSFNTNSSDENDSQNTYTEHLFSSLSVVFALLMIFMCLLGALMNTVSLWIFTRSSFRRRSINLLLCGLSLSDLCLCLLAIPVFSFSQLETIVKGIPIFVSTQILLYAYPVTLMAQTCTVWILVAITIERYLAVRHPFLVRVYCTTTRAVGTLLCILVFSVAYNFCRFWEYRVDDSGPEGQTSIVGLLRDNQLYMILYQNISMLLSQFILPLLVLCILNLQVARTILEAGETRRELVASEKREHSTAKMMLFIVIVFVFCYTLSFCLNVWEIFNPELFKQPVGFLLNDLNNILVIINSSSSFIFYTKYSSRYRAQLKKLPILNRFAFRCCLVPPKTHFSEKSQKSEYTNISTSYSIKQSDYTSSKQQLESSLNKATLNLIPEQDV